MKNDNRWIVHVFQFVCYILHILTKLPQCRSFGLCRRFMFCKNKVETPINMYTCQKIMWRAAPMALSGELQPIIKSIELCGSGGEGEIFEDSLPGHTRPINRLIHWQTRPLRKFRGSPILVSSSSGNQTNSITSRDYKMVSSVHPIVFSKFRILKVTITENRGFSYLKSLFLNQILQSQIWPEFLIRFKTLSHNIFPLENNHSPQLCHLPPLVALRQLNCAMLV